MKKPSCLWIGLCVIVFICFLIQGESIELDGDDLSYAAYFNYYGGGLLRYPQWVVRHWWLVNGRAANYIAPLLLYFSPRWLLVALNAIMASLFIFFSGQCLYGRGAYAKLLLGALLLLTMAWWDSSALFDVSFNYVWASAFGLCIVWLWQAGKIEGLTKGKLALACLFALFAGQMHEAMSVPLCAGIAAYYLMPDRRKAMSRRVKAFLASFFIGAMLCLFSAGIWRRLAMDSVPDDSAVMILLKSDFCALFLLVAVALCAAFDRKRLAAVANTPWIVFAVAGVASMCFSAVGGIVGRSGWFAQAFSLIALVWLFWPKRPSLALKLAAIILSAVAVCAWAAMTCVQWRLGKEARLARELYLNSPNGTFFMDHSRADKVPWYSLMRPRGAAVNSDDYTRWLFVEEYHIGKPYVMLPAADETFPVDSLLLKDAYSSRPRAEIMLRIVPYHGLWRDSLGNVWVEVVADIHGKKAYFSEPVELRPGDRLPPQWR
ncbi:MAG: DUF6056 family protein [Clostridium sp.]|nr:DUF6056 family protein [Clostridium sp.]